MIILSVPDWQTSAKQLSLPNEGSVHLWQIGGHSSTNPACLSVKEEKLVNKMPSDKADSYRCNRSGLRNILSKYTAVPGQEINIQYNSTGKPFLHSSPVEFNISHCTGLTLVAISNTLGVGVDAEKISTSRNILGIAKRMFEPEIYQQILHKSAIEQHLCFLRHWTQFEARVKALGSGIFDQNRLTAPSQSLHVESHWIAAIAFDCPDKKPDISHYYKL